MMLYGYDSINLLTASLLSITVLLRTFSQTIQLECLANDSDTRLTTDMLDSDNKSGVRYCHTQFIVSWASGHV